MGLGWGIVEGTMDKTKQNQGEVVGKDIYGFWESGGGGDKTPCLPSQQQEAETCS